MPAVGALNEKAHVQQAACASSIDKRLSKIAPTHCVQPPLVLQPVHKRVDKPHDIRRQIRTRHAL